MKQIVFLISLMATTNFAQAQTCKVSISYDANGNRIQRAIVCPSEHTNPNSVSLRTDKKQMSGLGELAEGSYQVYPNPAESKISIKISAELIAKGCGITMTDLTGKTLFQQRNITNSISAIDLHGYTDGTYFIIIATGNDRHTVKIVKQSGNGY